ncbi:PTS sugar transporter subunit IIA [Streptococcus ictaluri]|uniref:Phosphoenolpyruvate-dependent sugar PTS family porter, EIIA 2 n=1 Tax=Streptococcus ictaluri 707-05 TaxID=764299 RepID=G5K491_9STRE|nr:PTS sugar transporter subunit IIA [Streptococcus ictaluri]EHI69080.1 phosphoenolpyruvate-dependent sugar PTS family porter, EIIA 2 [Streptococcus ictaluri 707-05]
MFSNTLFTDAKTQEELFAEVAKHLVSVDYVTPDYGQALLEREKVFPTGLKVDLKDGSELLYAAIPHTETQFCLVDQVVYVKNSQPITFQHMINLEEKCLVPHCFFIINSRANSQTEILSNLITFFITKGNLAHLSQLGKNEEAISSFLKEKGVFQND